MKAAVWRGKGKFDPKCGVVEQLGEGVEGWGVGERLIRADEAGHPTDN